MHQALALWGSRSPVQVGFSLFVLGTVVGSFCNVIRHRIPLGISVLWGRSECPNCGHRLNARDLVPVLSYVLLRGRCRYCTLKISVIYPLIEVAAGVVSGLAGIAQGWTAGFLALGTWVASTLVFALWERRRPLGDESGASLVEVMACLFLLAVAMLPALDALTVARRAGLATQQRSVLIGVARARVNQLSMAASADITAVDGESGDLPGDAVTGEASFAQYVVSTSPPDSAGMPAGARKVSVTVSCPTCQGTHGFAVQPVTLTTIVRERLNGE